MDMAFIDIRCIVATCKCDFNTRELALIGFFAFLVYCPRGTKPYVQTICASL